jgi:hypothetical protein
MVLGGVVLLYTAEQAVKQKWVLVLYEKTKTIKSRIQEDQKLQEINPNLVREFVPGD